MKIIETAIEGVVIIEPRLFKDERGYFSNLSHKESLKKKFVKYLLYKTMRVNLLMEYYADSIFRNHHTHKASLFVSLKVLYLMLPLISAKALPLLETCCSRINRRKPSSAFHTSWVCAWFQCTVTRSYLSIQM